MGSLINFPPSSSAAWKLTTNCDDGQNSIGRKAVMHVRDVATVCVINDIPSVGDVIYGNVWAVVEKVRIGRDGVVRVYARPIESDADTDRAPSAASKELSPRVAGVLAELRRRRLRQPTVAIDSLESEEAQT